MKVYTGFDLPPGCMVSEKFDAICAIWDGHELRTRTGNRIDAPAWFTAGLPNRPLRGELWAGRGGFQTVLSICTSYSADDRWLAIRFMVFDDHPEGAYAIAVARVPVRSRADLDAARDAIVAEGGEGVVLRDPDGVDWKHKPIADDDAVVIAHVPGTASPVGSLLVRDRDGLEFRLGAGLTASDRRRPPAIGSVVCYEYQGRTTAGKPRSASFLCLRAEASLGF